MAADQQSTAIGDDMALAPLDQLGRIEAPDTLAFRGFHGLAVDHAGRRAGLASRRFTRGHEKVMVESAQRSVGTPSIEVTLDRTARRELPRQHPPLAARARHVQDRVQHLAQVSRPRPAMPFAGGKVQGNHFPFLVRQVACVTQARPLILGTSDFSPHSVFSTLIGHKRENHNTLKYLNSFQARHLAS